MTNLLAEPSPVAVNTGIAVSASVDDSGRGDSVVTSAEYGLDDGSWVGMGASDRAFYTATEAVVATIPEFPPASVHEIWVRGTDAAGGASLKECIILAVYDSEGGYVIGSGWIDSPAGSGPRCDASPEGKANFGYVSKSMKGAEVPTGNTQFQFKAGNLSFRSDSYDWLVLAGANAKYKGEGTIKGEEGASKFMLTATDGDLLGGGQADELRIKIWDDAGLCYDNKSDLADEAYGGTELGGGNIQIHKGK